MLQIKNNQLEAIIAIQHTAFVLRLKKHLDKFFHELIALLNPEELDYFIEEGIRKARKYKLETEYQITVYFNIMLTLGIDFEKEEQHSWAADILKDNQMDTEWRVRELISRTERLLEA